MAAVSNRRAATEQMPGGLEVAATFAKPAAPARLGLVHAGGLCEGGCGFQPPSHSRWHSRWAGAPGDRGRSNPCEVGPPPTGIVHAGGTLRGWPRFLTAGPLPPGLTAEQTERRAADGIRQLEVAATLAKPAAPPALDQSTQVDFARVAAVSNRRATPAAHSERWPRAPGDRGRSNPCEVGPPPTGIVHAGGLCGGGRGF